MCYEGLFSFYLSIQENTQNKKDDDSHSVPLFTEDTGQFCMWLEHSSNELSQNVFLDRFETTPASTLQ